MIEREEYQERRGESGRNGGNFGIIEKRRLRLERKSDRKREHMAISGGIDRW